MNVLRGTLIEELSCPITYLKEKVSKFIATKQIHRFNVEARSFVEHTLRRSTDNSHANFDLNPSRKDRRKDRLNQRRPLKISLRRMSSRNPWPVPSTPRVNDIQQWREVEEKTAGERVTWGFELACYIQIQRWPENACAKVHHQLRMGK